MCRELYNAALQERIESYKTPRKGVTWLQQQAQLPAIKEVRPELYKAESAGRKLIAVNPRRTSQMCVCGAPVRKRLSDREHVCTACGLIANRDHLSAQVILQRAGTQPLDANVSEVTLCVVYRSL